MSKKPPSLIRSVIRSLVPSPVGAAREALELRYNNWRARQALKDIDLNELNRGWVTPGQEDIELDEWTRSELEDTLITLYNKHDTVRNIIENFVLFVVGRRIEVQFKSKELQQRYEILDESVNFNAVYENGVRMSLMLGNWFYLMLPFGAPMRFGLLDLDARKVAEINTAPNNPGIVTHYTLKGASEGHKKLDSADVIHFHNVKFGRQLFARPLCEPVLDRIAQLDNLIEDQLEARRIKSMLHWVRYRKGPPPATPLEDIPDSAIIEAHDEQERYESLTQDVDSSEAWRDVDGLLSRIAAGLNVPIEFVKMDISGSPSGEMHLESIPVKRFQSLQRHYNRQFLAVLRGMLSPKLRAGEVTIVNDPVDIRTQSRRTEDISKLVQENLISRKTGQEELGYNPGKENERIDEELRASAGGAGAAGQGGASLDALAGNLGNGGAEAPAAVPAAAAGPAEAAPADGGGQAGGGGGAIPQLATAGLSARENLEQEKHLIESFDENNLIDDDPELHRKILVVDDGFQHDLCVVVMGLSEDDGIVVRREEYHKHLPLIHPDGEGAGRGRVSLVQAIREEEGAELVVLDPTALELAALLKHKGESVQLAERDVEGGFGIVETEVAQNRLRVRRDLKRLVAEFTEGRAKQGEEGPRKKPATRKLHGLDCVRYGVAYLRKQGA